MRRDVVTIPSRETMRAAQYLMRDARISGLPVVDDGAMVGIVTVEDVIKALDHGDMQAPVAEWMTAEVVIVKRRWPLAQAMAVLDETGHGQLPVLDDEGSLCGLITPESILAAMLVQLNRLLARDEEQESARKSVHDQTTRLEFEVAARDYDRAGLASVRLKRELAAHGVAPSLQRRAAIAAHEAETNLIIHTARGGRIVAEVAPGAIELTVNDDGPGIKDIERAMTPGFSTASDFVRDLGFGAGMGLPNIRRCADRFEIQSTPGLGTQLVIGFDRRTDEAAAEPREAP
ncbi:MAG: CBS domain-containing protein [Armatimonadetes bacterium]|nr:CBS domain-containing protein [Armatimonadota bacterium]